MMDDIKIEITEHPFNDEVTAGVVHDLKNGLTLVVSRIGFDKIKNSDIGSNNIFPTCKVRRKCKTLPENKKKELFVIINRLSSEKIKKNVRSSFKNFTRKRKLKKLPGDEKKELFVIVDKMCLNKTETSIRNCDTNYSLSSSCSNVEEYTKVEPQQAQFDSVTKSLRKSTEKGNASKGFCPFAELDPKVEIEEHPIKVDCLEECYEIEFLETGSSNRGLSNELTTNSVGNNVSKTNKDRSTNIRDNNPNSSESELNNELLNVMLANMFEENDYSLVNRENPEILRKELNNSISLDVDNSISLHFVEESSPNQKDKVNDLIKEQIKDEVKQNSSADNLKLDIDNSISLDLENFINSNSLDLDGAGQIQVNKNDDFVNWNVGNEDEYYLKNQKSDADKNLKLDIDYSIIKEFDQKHAEHINFVKEEVKIGNKHSAVNQISSEKNESMDLIDIEDRNTGDSTITANVISKRNFDHSISSVPNESDNYISLCVEVSVNSISISVEKTTNQAPTGENIICLNAETIRKEDATVAKTCPTVLNVERGSKMELNNSSSLELDKPGSNCNFLHLEKSGNIISLNDLNIEEFGISFQNQGEQKFNSLNAGIEDEGETIAIDNAVLSSLEPLQRSCQNLINESRGANINNSEMHKPSGTSTSADGEGANNLISAYEDSSNSYSLDVEESFRNHSDKNMQCIDENKPLNVTSTNSVLTDPLKIDCPNALNADKSSENNCTSSIPLDVEKALNYIFSNVVESDIHVPLDAEDSFENQRRESTQSINESGQMNVESTTSLLLDPLKIERPNILNTEKNSNDNCINSDSSEIDESGNGIFSDVEESDNSVTLEADESSQNQRHKNVDCIDKSKPMNEECTNSSLSESLKNDCANPLSADKNSKVNCTNSVSLDECSNCLSPDDPNNSVTSNVEKSAQNQRPENTGLNEKETTSEVTNSVLTDPLHIECTNVLVTDKNVDNNSALSASLESEKSINFISSSLRDALQERNVENTDDINVEVKNEYETGGSERFLPLTETLKIRSLNSDFKNQPRNKGVLYKCSEYNSKSKGLADREDTTNCTFETKNNKKFKRHLRTHVRRLPLTCKLCQKVFQAISVLDHHYISKHKSDKDIWKNLIKSKIRECPKCPYKAGRLYDIKRHMLIHKGGQHKNIQQIYKCNICDYKTRTKCFLKNHLDIHAGNSRFSCAECNKNFISKQVLDIHIIARHSDNENMLKMVTSKIHKCKSCSFQTVHSQRLKIHVNNHSKIKKSPIKGPPFICKECDKNFRKKRTFDNHILKRHTEDKNMMQIITCKIHTCHQCSYKTTIRGELSFHISRNHERGNERDRAYECYTCGYKTTNRSCLIIHLRKHSKEKLYFCMSCNENFMTKILLNGHILAKHSSDENLIKTVKNKIYRCDKCSYKTFLLYRFTNHSKTHQVKTKKYVCESLLNKENAPGGEIEKCLYSTNIESLFTHHLMMHSLTRTFFCKLCHKIFKKKLSLDNHYYAKHINEKDDWESSITFKLIKCPKCPYVTVQAYYLKNHLLTHDQVTSIVTEDGTPYLYQCNVCQYQTEERDNFVTHLKEHVREQVNYFCKPCNKVFYRKGRLDDHIILRHPDDQTAMSTVTSKVYSCDKCPFRTIYNSRFKDHMKIRSHTTTADKKDMFECCFCDFETRIERYFNRHMNVHHGDGYFCTACDVKFKSKQVLDNHILKAHPCDEKLLEKITNAVYKCDKCSYKTVVSTHIKRHENTHLDIEERKKYRTKDNLVKPKEIDETKRRYLCDICGYKTNYRNYLRKHLLKHTGQVPLLSCKSCSKTFLSKNLLDNHIIRQHSEDQSLMETVTHKNLTCDLCSYKTMFRSSMKKHLKTHSRGKLENEEKKFICGVCDYKTDCKSYFSKHLLIHTGELPFLCEKCDKTFITKQLLDNHIVTRHSEDEDMMQTVTNKIHICDKCSYKTILSTCFKAHEKTCSNKITRKKVLDDKHNNSKVKNYQCYTCSFKTLKKNYLIMHLQKHTGDLPFMCELCEKKFVTKQLLDNHIVTRHSDDKSIMRTVTSKIHRCDKCSYKTVLTTCLKTHSSKHK